jgi:predicted trehalose synthase
MSGHGEKKSRKREAALAALLSEASIEKAALKAGVAVRTLHNWLADPAFASEYRTIRRQLVEAAVGRLQNTTGEAADALRKLLKCRNPAVVARVALGILDQAVKGVELGDQAERLERLERLEEARAQADKKGGAA